MKKTIALILMLCLLLVGCGQEAEVAVTPENVPETTAAQPTVAATVVNPLPDSAMENMTDAVLFLEPQV